MASIGFVAALLPLALLLIRGFVRNARRLDRLSRDLGEAVRLRSREVMRVQRELADAQRHASIGRVAASVAHDINNPLAWLVLNTDLLREQVARQPVSVEAQESIDGIVEGAHRIKEAVEALRARTRWSPGMRVVVAPERLLRVALKAASEGLHRTHDITLDIGPTPLVTVDEGELMRILADLISCAGRVPTAQRGGIPLHVASTTDGEGWVQLRIHVERGRTGESLVPILSSISAEQESALAEVSDAVERNGGQVELREDASAWTITVRFPPAEEQVTSDGRAVASLPAMVG
jgi:signal transduction histidine kinase